MPSATAPHTGFVTPFSSFANPRFSVVHFAPRYQNKAFSSFAFHSFLFIAGQCAPSSDNVTRIHLQQQHVNAGI